MEPEQYLTSYGWTKGKLRWSHPSFKGWFTTEDAVVAQVNLRREQLAFELDFGTTKRLLTALTSLKRDFPAPVPTNGYPSRFAAIVAYVAQNPNATYAQLRHAFHLPANNAHSYLQRAKKRIAKMANAPTPPPLPPSPPPPAKVVVTPPPEHGIPNSSKRMTRAERERRLLPMLFGHGDRRDECTSYDTCMDRAAHLLSGREQAHCPSPCEQYEAHDRRTMLDVLASSNPLS